jgi:radical SAM superfamily enzyme YgiQ (UPF0313 family)
MFPCVHDFGLRSISACLKQAGHDVNLFFLMKEFHKRYSETAMYNLVKLTKGSDLAGISLMSNFFDNAIQITQKLRNNYDFPILWGGTHPTIRPEESLQHADMVCIGEGEETVVELADKIQNKQYYHDVKGMGFNDKGKIIVNGHRELPGSAKAKIKSLDELPFQDYDLESHFVLKGKDIVKMDQKIMEQCGETYQTLPTRGCPFACTYCVNDTFLKMYPHQKPIRKRSVDNIIKELQEVKSKLPFVEIIRFSDDAFFLMSVDEIKELSKRYKEQIGLPLVILGATPSTLTEEKISPLVDAGLIEIHMGIQSMAENTKKLYKRPFSNRQIENAAKILNKYRDQLTVNYDIILDSPWDTDEDLIENLMFLSKLPTPFRLSLYSLTFYPKTNLYRKAKKEGLIKDDLNDIYRKHYEGCANTYLNKLFYLMRGYAFVGIGISPIIMFILTHKITKKLYLHKFLRNVIRALLPLFRFIGQSTRRSTRLYKIGNIIEFREGKTYRTYGTGNFNLSEFHGDDPNEAWYGHTLVKPSPWLIRKFRKIKLMLFKAIYEYKGEDIIKKK